MFKKVNWSELSFGQKVVVGIGLLAAAAALGPVAAQAAASITNLLQAALAALGLFAIFVFFPLFKRFLSNMVLKFMKAEARMNPIETLENDYLKKEKSLKDFVEFVTDMIAAHRVSQEELNALKEKFPDRDLGDRQGMVDKMGQAVNVLYEKAGDAKEKLAKYKNELEFIKADHQWSKRFSGALGKLQNVEGVDALDELLKGEAIGQVRQDVARAFAELDMLVAQEGTQSAIRNANQIAHDTSREVLDIDVIEIPHLAPPVKVGKG